MSWKIKVFLFWVFGLLPQGRLLYQFAQKFITKRHIREYLPLAKSCRAYLENIAIFQKHFCDLSEKRYFEFGAGNDLLSVFINYCFGFNEQWVVDIHEIATQEQVNRVIEILRSHPLPDFKRLPCKLIEEDLKSDLQRYYGIYYLAPINLKQTKFEKGFFDIIATTNTLEHIPSSDLISILQECNRLCHLKSLVVMQVDYSDHYFHTDRSISPYNFLKYSKFEWFFLNPSFCYQNRLRHSDYKTLFKNSGFEIASEESQTPTDGEIYFQAQPVHKSLMYYNKDDLLKTSGCYILRKEK